MLKLNGEKSKEIKEVFEFLGGKQELVKLGIFDEIDISMMTHARGNFSGFGYGGTGNGLVAKFIEFHGVITCWRRSSFRNKCIKMLQILRCLVYMPIEKLSLMIII